MIYTVIIVASFAAGLPWGVLGVASAYAIVMVPITLVGFWIALRLVDLRLTALARTLARTIGANAAMAVAVGGAAAWLQSARAGDVRLLLVCIPLGVLVYGAAIWVRRPEALDDVLRLVHLRKLSESADLSA